MSGISDTPLTDQAFAEAEGTEQEDANLNQETEAEQEASGTSEEQELEASQSELEDEGTSEEAEEKWLVPGRFKTVDDLAKSYFELEREYSRTKNAQKQPEAKPKKDPKKEIEDFAKKAQENPVEAIRAIIEETVGEKIKPLQQENANTKLDREYAALKQSQEDFDEHEPIMTQIAMQFDDYPESVRQDPRTLHLLYYAAKGMNMGKTVSKSIKKGETKGEKKTLKKVKAQVEGKSGTQGENSKPFEDLSLEEMKKELKRQGLA